MNDHQNISLQIFINEKDFNFALYYYCDVYINVPNRGKLFSVVTKQRKFIIFPQVCVFRLNDTMYLFIYI